MAVNGRAWLAELIATFALVFFGPISATLALVTLGIGVEDTSILLIGLTHGLTITLMIYAIGHVSGGHINPAVTIAMLVTRRIGGANAVGYIIFQLIGAVLAAGAHAIILPQGSRIFYGLNQPGPGVSDGTALLMEVILTFFLVFVIFGAVVHPKAAPGWAGFAIGMTVALDHFVGIPISGASMNPARTFGPAVITGNFNAHLIYWAGPIIGAVIAALLYYYVFVDKADRVAST